MGSHHRVQRLSLLNMLRLQARDGTESSFPAALMKIANVSIKIHKAWPCLPLQPHSSQLPALAPGTKLGVVPQTVTSL